MGAGSTRKSLSTHTKKEHEPCPHWFRAIDREIGTRHFLNTREPYQVERCLECNTQFLILLPVLQKAHVFEPSIEDVAEVSFQAGMQEMVDWVKEQTAFIDDEDYPYYILNKKIWQDQLKKKGLEAKMTQGHSLKQPEALKVVPSRVSDGTGELICKGCGNLESKCRCEKCTDREYLAGQTDDEMALTPLELQGLGETEFHDSQWHYSPWEIMRTQLAKVAPIYAARQDKAVEKERERILAILNRCKTEWMDETCVQIVQFTPSDWKEISGEG